MGNSFNFKNISSNLENIKKSVNSYNSFNSNKIKFNSEVNNSYNYTNTSYDYPENVGFYDDINSVKVNEKSSNAVDIKNSLIDIVQNDPQVDMTNNFDNYSDFQNIVISNLSFFEIFYANNADSLKDKTIEQLFLESFMNSSQEYDINDYLDFVFDTDTLVSLNEDEMKNKYLNLFLGKLILYGFSDLKIKELVNGKNGFDAIVVEDINGNYMVYYSCTDLYEIEDYLYDIYPILDSFSAGNSMAANLIKSKDIYNSQQSQALELLNKYLYDDNDNIVNVGGFSLGGSLAEYAYFSNYGKTDKLENIVLFNPYHIDVNKDLLNDASQRDKFKLYASEGDAVSTVFNYDTYFNNAKSVYINYPNVVEYGKQIVNSDNNYLNTISTNLKNNYCNNIISICNKLIDEKKFSNFLGVESGLKGIANLAKKMKKYEVDTQGFLNCLDKCYEFSEPVLNLLEEITGVNLDFDFIGDFQYLEIIFTGVHLPYSIETSKNTSFDQNGMVKKNISSDDNYDVIYPNFDEISKLIFGYNIYDEVKNLIYNIGG